MPPVSYSQAVGEPIGYLLVAAGWRVPGRNWGRDADRDRA
jgi:hypothetical protein